MDGFLAAVVTPTFRPGVFDPIAEMESVAPEGAYVGNDYDFTPAGEVLTGSGDYYREKDEGVSMAGGEELHSDYTFGM